MVPHRGIHITYPNYLYFKKMINIWNHKLSLTSEHSQKTYLQENDNTLIREIITNIIYQPSKLTRFPAQFALVNVSNFYFFCL